MAWLLRRDTPIGRGGAIVVLPRGTRLSDLGPDDVSQLAPDHFAEGHAGDDGPVFTNPDARPDEWRTEEATLEHDRRQAANTEAEAEERAARKADKNRGA